MLVTLDGFVALSTIAGGIGLVSGVIAVPEHILDGTAFTSYLVTATVSGPIYGKLSDIFGRRPIFIFGVLIFLGGSVLSGLSGDMLQFIAFRGLQGLGAGALFPVALSIIGDIFAPSERGKYQGFFGAVMGSSVRRGKRDACI